MTQPESTGNSIFPLEMTDKEINKMETDNLSRRRLIRDICLATGWVFLGHPLISKAAEPDVKSDPSNDDKNWGSIKGRLVYEGEPPAQKEIELEKLGITPADMTWFKSKGPILNQDWVINPETKSIQWVYVWLLPEDPKGTFKSNPKLLDLPPEKKMIIVDQEPSGYVPHAIALQLTQGIQMRNKGPVAHVFKFDGFANDSMNKAMAPGASIEVKELKLERIAIQVTCPPHPWERMWLKNFDHPYFAITDANGNFEIKLAPAGKCRIVVWHEQVGFLGGKAGRNGSEIEVTGGAITDLGDFKLSAKG